MPKRNQLSTVRYAMDKQSAELNRFLDGMNFSSIDDANKLLRAATVYKNGFLLPERPAHLKALSEFDVETASAEMRELWQEELMDVFPEIPERWAKAMSPDSPIERAQICMSDAWEALDDDRTKLAKKALEIYEDCADAYVLLAQESMSLEEAKELYEKAFELGERQLQTCAQPVQFWSDLRTRPYFRARSGLAATLWQLGSREDAIDHLFEMLCQDSDDHMGNRYQLWHYLLQVRDFDELQGFLSADEEGTATWKFTSALMQFMKEGASQKSDRALRDALTANGFVADFLLGERPIPEVMPAYVGQGDVDEAVEYVAWASRSWKQEADALDWLRRVRERFAARTKHHSFKVWKNAMQDAQRAGDADQLGKARGHLLYALRQCEKFEPDEFLLETLQALAIVCCDLEAVKQDEEVFQRPVKLAEQLYGEESKEVATALSMFALYLVECNRWKEAEEALHRAQSIAEETESDELEATVYIGFAKLYKRQGKLDLAKQYERKVEEFLYPDDNSESEEDEDDISDALNPHLRVVPAHHIRKD